MYYPNSVPRSIYVCKLVYDRNSGVKNTIGKSDLVVGTFE